VPTEYNKAGFRAAATGESHALPRVYCGLVLIELALKDNLNVPGLKHDLPIMLRKVSLANRSHKAAINQHICELTNRLAVLHVSAVDGSPSRARATAYPDIRYVRHTSDWTEQFSTDKEIEDLRICVGKIRAFLKTNLAIS